jgi:sirohydrochlorin cobaltochelatase
MQALILFAHGSRDPAWFVPFEALAARVRVHSPHTAVHLAYLEFAQPSLQDAINAAVAGGASEIRVVPVFLAAGAHVRNDLPLLLEQARERHAGIKFELRPPVGEDNGVLEAISRAALE